jgi:hypothetical protein
MVVEIPAIKPNSKPLVREYLSITDDPQEFNELFYI